MFFYENLKTVMTKIIKKYETPAWFSAKTTENTNFSPSKILFSTWFDTRKLKKYCKVKKNRLPDSVVLFYVAHHAQSSAYWRHELPDHFRRPFLLFFIEILTLSRNSPLFETSAICAEALPLVNTSCNGDSSLSRKKSSDFSHHWAHLEK